MDRVIAVIPARGGSKRLPGKNTKPFFGKPIIQYSIDAALKSQMFEHVIVTTDSEQIADTARAGGANVPFLRPANLSDDYTPIPEVLAHTIEWYNSTHPAPCQYVCFILATAPFVQAQYLQKGYELIRSNDVTSAVPVASFAYPIFRALDLRDNNKIKMFWPEHEFTRSNDLPDAYHDAGQFYWVNVEKFMKSKRLLSPDSIAFEIPRYLVQDIDTPEDWVQAEKLYSVLST